MEWHILNDGAIFVVGFVSRETRTVLQKSDSRGREVTLYLARWRGATEIVAAPLAELTIRDMRRIETDDRNRPYVRAYDFTINR